ncbi:hypothetical protein VKT23_009788 [Stygiomarasmius scandens]|uniref:Alcohol dehydrogenase-like C-terminal domain-containing protein n=1 Tax=Marasmiellus scandens TaxID=2682957 RepID=A0ABR1JDA5_9AGAR
MSFNYYSISGFGIGLVFKSEGKNYSEGDHVSYPLMDFAEYTVVPESYLPYLTKIVQHTGLSLSTYLGGAGMPEGQTAYYGWKEFCANFKKGGTAFVSGAAGPIGSYVVQLAKRDGLKVIASAGSQAKVNFLKALGADVVVNYKAEGLHLALQKNGPVDVYWDNVGGSTLDAALENASLGAHFVICGMISQYSSMKEGVNMKNLPNIFTQHITLHGFRMAELEGKWKRDFNETVPEMLASGEIKYHENIVKGLDKAGDALLDLMAGNSMGKTIILVSN